MGKILLDKEEVIKALEKGVTENVLFARCKEYNVENLYNDIAELKDYYNDYEGIIDNILDMIVDEFYYVTLEDAKSILREEIKKGTISMPMRAFEALRMLTDEEKED